MITYSVQNEQKHEAPQEPPPPPPKDEQESKQKKLSNLSPTFSMNSRTINRELQMYHKTVVAFEDEPRRQLL